jgi:glycosyltransferase involved in cell wall biosynthesis
MLNAMKKRITIVSPCYNEEGNITDLYEQLLSVVEKHAQYDWDYLFIDNASTDDTQKILRDLAKRDPKVRCIFNARNFGHMRSPYYAILQTSSDATILMASDLQDPPALISQFIEKWEAGSKVVMAVKSESEESWAMFAIRSAYYAFINRLSNIELIKNATGFGLYDKCIVEVMKRIPEYYPYFRGIVSEIGYQITTVHFRQPTRRRGITKNNFYTLYDIAMTGVTSHSRVPLRVATIGGFVMSALGLLLAFGYFLAKLIFWYQFPMGMSPVLIGFFFFASVQLFFIGVIGEYIGSIYTQIQQRPLVIEKERINF